MKKILYIMSIAALAAACQKQAPTDDLVRVRLGIEGQDPTKTCFIDQSATGYSVGWSGGDKVIMNGVESLALAASSEGSASATFTFNFKGQTDKLTSPYNLLYCGVAGTDNTVFFQGTQKEIDGNVAPNTLPMYATSASTYENVTMNHLASVLKISLTDTKGSTLKRITVEALGGEKLSGKFSLGKAEGGKFDASVFSPSGENATTVAIESESGSKLGSVAKDFYIAIPAGTYTKGFYGQIIMADNSLMEVYFDTMSEKTFGRGVIYDFGTNAFVNMGKVVVTVCGTENFNVEAFNYE